MNNFPVFMITIKRWDSWKELFGIHKNVLTCLTSKINADTLINIIFVKCNIHMLMYSEMNGIMSISNVLEAKMGLHFVDFLFFFLAFSL